MTAIIPDYQIAAGNNNAGGLTPVDELVDSNSIKFVMPRGLPFRVRGQVRTRLDGTTGRVGFNSTQWLSAVMTVDQLSTVYSTYEGLVTIRIALTSTSFANYNAVLRMPDEGELEYMANVLRMGTQTGTNGGLGPGYSSVPWFFTKLEAL
jgi:hypothetical protein